MIGLFVQNDYPLDLVEESLDITSTYALSGKGVKDKKLYTVLKNKGFNVTLFYQDEGDGRAFDIDGFINSLTSMIAFPTTEWSLVPSTSRGIITLFYKTRRLKPYIPVLWNHKKVVYKRRTEEFNETTITASTSG